jgi:hypothetical protein
VAWQVVAAAVSNQQEAPQYFSTHLATNALAVMRLQLIKLGIKHLQRQLRVLALCAGLGLAGLITGQ